jgi:predicted naringenin-chalcone synthase
MVANAIFSDGAAAALYCSADNESVEACSKAEVSAAHSDVSSDTLEKMSWRIGDHGFLMTLDAGVPSILETAAPDFLKALAAEARLTPDDISGWAIHPGGRKIIESLRNCLGLSDSDVSSSTSVLRNYGNMSSATILFVLEQELSRGLTPGSPIAALAFGPGLTMEGIILRSA